MASAYAFSHAVAKKSDDLVVRTSAWHPEWSSSRIHVMHCELNDRCQSRHDHLFHEIVVIESGKVIQEVVDGKHLMRPGDIMVMHPQSWHSFHTRGEASLFNCLFDASLVMAPHGLFASLQGAFNLFRRRHVRPHEQPPVFLRPDASERDELRMRIHSMTVEQQAQHPGWEVAQLSHLLVFLVAIGRLAQRQQTGMNHENVLVDHHVLHAIDLLDAGCEQSWTLGDLAKTVAISPFELSRRFNDAMGMSIPEYINTRRVEEACRRLAITDAPITTIAFDTGFQDPSYFARIFRRVTGMSPREYRKRHAVQGYGLSELSR